MQITRTESQADPQFHVMITRIQATRAWGGKPPRREGGNARIGSKGKLDLGWCTPTDENLKSVGWNLGVQLLVQIWSVSGSNFKTLVFYRSMKDEG